MSEIATVAPVSMVPAHLADKDIAELSGNGFGGFLPRLSLCGASSNLCKEGKIPVGMYAFISSKEKFENLGASVNVMLFGFRLKATRFLEKQILTYYDPSKEEFQKIKAVSLDKDSGCLAGPEYLCWVPGKGWCTLYLTSKSARNESPNLKSLLGKACTLTVFLAENQKKQKWHVIRSAPCSLPLDQPNEDEKVMQINKFTSAIDSVIQAAPEDAAGEQRDM